jgi:hypothetical protein
LPTMGYQAVQKLGGNSKNSDTTHIAHKLHMHTMTLLQPLPPPPCAHCRLHVLLPLPPLLFLPPPCSLQIFTNRNLGLASVGPLRISPELQLVIFQQGNKGSGPVIGWSKAPSAATSIFCRHCHCRHWVFFGGGGCGGGGGSGDGSGGGIGDGGGNGVAGARAVAVEVAVVRAVAVEWRWSGSGVVVAVVVAVEWLLNGG